MNTQEWINRRDEFQEIVDLLTQPRLGGDERCTGRTTAMLQQLVEAVLEGQPKSVVIGWNIEDARRLQNRFQDLLSNREVQFICDRSTLTTEVDGSVIRFISKTIAPVFLEARRGWGEFWDHFAEGES